MQRAAALRLLLPQCKRRETVHRRKLDGSSLRACSSKWSPSATSAVAPGRVRDRSERRRQAAACSRRPSAVSPCAIGVILSLESTVVLPLWRYSASRDFRSSSAMRICSARWTRSASAFHAASDRWQRSFTWSSTASSPSARAWAARARKKARFEVRIAENANLLGVAVVRRLCLFGCLLG